jgi:peptidoglycan/LPS O-acetylase OafA/YrhL
MEQKKLAAASTKTSSERFPMLDGWRGVSILLILATHLLPLGPSQWRLNSTAGPMGMALFFTLSGFLITNFLILRPEIYAFLIRRFARILPLAWLYITVALSLSSTEADVYLSHYLFYANWPPMSLTDTTGHLWSLCVEMQHRPALFHSQAARIGPAPNYLPGGYRFSDNERCVYCHKYLLQD